MILGENTKLPDKPFDGEVIGYENFHSIDGIRILRCEVVRQEKYIDLIAKITTQENNQSSYYLLNIENKYYHDIDGNQLQRSLAHVKNKYQNDYNIVNILITPDHCKINESVIDLCKEIGYKIIAIPQLQRLIETHPDIPTGNYMFDEFWY